MKIVRLLFLLISVHACSKVDPEVFIDEKKSSIEDFMAIDTSKIYSVVEWPAGVVPRKWKEQSDKGVVVVHTKEFNEKFEKQRYEILIQKVDEAIAGNADNMLFYFNGIKVPFDKLLRLKELMPMQLKSIEIMDSIKGKIFYENEARAENIVINTKDLDTSLIKK